MEEILTKADFARRRGVSRGTVINWFRREQLTKACVTDDGLVIVAVAERELRDRLDSVRSATMIATAERKRRRGASSPDRRASKNIPTETAPDSGAENTQAETISDRSDQADESTKVEEAPGVGEREVPPDQLHALRIKRAEIEVEHRRLLLNAARGRYVQVAGVSAAHGSKLAQAIAAFENALLDAAVEADISEAQLAIMQGVFRRVREREAAEALARAAALPEFVADDGSP
jgi:hypothetical protein